MSKIGLMCSPDWCAQVQRNPAHWDITCPSGYLYELLRCRDGSSKSSRRLRLPDLAALHRKDAVQEHQEANQGCGKQHPCVPAEPGKVQADLLSEIPPGAAEPGRNRSNRREKSSGSCKKAHSSRAASVLVFWEMSKTLPDEVQWLILVPSPPPGPALVQQMQVVLCSVRSDWIFAVILPLTWKDTHYTLFGQSHLMNNLAKCQKKKGKGSSNIFWKKLTSWRGKAASYELLLKRRLSPRIRKTKYERRAA